MVGHVDAMVASPSPVVEAPACAPVIDVVLPVYNEQAALGPSVERLHGHLSDAFPFTWRITIADNASTDRTAQIAAGLAATLPHVRVVRLDAKGRGRALRTAWTTSDAAVLAYMDIDLSTDLAALLPLVAPLVSGHSDIAIGSRLAVGSRTVRGPQREAISRAYNRLIRCFFHNRFRDAQCGFKALRADVASRLLPEVVDQAWFFDTELLLLAEHNGLRIAEVPVDWVDDPHSSVDIVRTATEDLKGLARVARRFWWGDGLVDLAEGQRRPTPVGTGGEIVTFAKVGVLSTVAALGLFLVLRDPLGSMTANVVALAATAGLNTAANRRWTFGLRGRVGRARMWRRASAVHCSGLVITTAALAVAQAVDGGSLGTELILLSAASAVSTGLRVLLMPAWVLSRRASPSAPTLRGSRPPLLRRLPVLPVSRALAVSAITTAWSAAVLGVLSYEHVMAAGWANVVSTLAGIAPSYVLNRRWVWGRTDPSNIAREVAPFVGLCLLALAVSTGAVWAADRWARAAELSATPRTAVVLAASVGSFTALWCAQFLLSRTLFTASRKDS
jgi:putative flippase GtrA